MHITIAQTSKSVGHDIVEKYNFCCCFLVPLKQPEQRAAYSRVTEVGREAEWGWRTRDEKGRRRLPQSGDRAEKRSRVGVGYLRQEGVGHDWQSRDRARKRGRVGVGYPKREGVGHDCQSSDRAGKRGRAGGCGRYPVRGEVEDTVVRQRRGAEGPWMEGRGGGVARFD